MGVHNLVFGIITVLSTLAHGSGYTAPAYTLKANNQSLLLGYQLYGSHIYNAPAVCKDIDVASHGIWDLSTWMVQRAFCDQLSATSANRTVISPLGWESDMIKQNVRFFSTGLFITHLWYSFDLSRYPNSTSTILAFSPHPFAQLCAVLQPTYLEAFDLDSVRIRSAFCLAANITSFPPAPPTTTAISQPVLAGYSDIISTLFAYLLISSSRNSVEADEICVKAKERQADVENSGLTAHTVYHVACGRDGRRMAEDESSVAMQLWTTKAYLTILENASADDEWMPWLCDNLDEGSMNVTSLLGIGIMREVCGKKKLGNGECGYDWRTING